MSENKSYYYLKLKESFFESPSVRVLLDRNNGQRLVLLLLRMYLSALHYDGLLCLTPDRPYTVETLAAVTGENVRFVSGALNLFRELGLVTVLPSGFIFMDEIQNYVGKSSTEGDRKREYRSRIRRMELSAALTGENSGTNVRPKHDNPDI